MEITFYYAPMSSAVPVACALAELAVPHRKVTFDLAKQEQRQADFLKLNPNGKVPTLVVDGTPMFEAVAIMQWLGDRFGTAKGLWPAFDSPARLQAVSWSTWAYVSFGQSVGRLHLASAAHAPAELKSQAWANFSRAELQSLLGILDDQLAVTGFIVGDRYSLADLIVSGVVLWGQMTGVSTADHPHVGKWLGECSARPAIKTEWGM